MGMRGLFALLVLGSVSVSCIGPNRAAEFEALGPLLDGLMDEHGVPGAGFAVFDDHGLLYEHISGFKSSAGPEPIDSHTAFEAASISKPLFAYVMHSLARDGVLDLDASLETLVTEIPELAYDPRASTLTPRILLTHRSGLPNWRSRMNFDAQNYSQLFAPDDRLEFVADPGTQYRYSGEGYVLLQRIVEQTMGTGLNELATERIFSPLGMTNSSFLFDEKTRGNYALGHDRDGGADKWEVVLPLSSSTLHTTASDLAKFGVHLAAEIRSDGPYAQLATADQTVETVGDLVRSWGPGLGVITDGPRRYVYHGGNNVIFIADFIYGVEENLGYVLLTNSANGQLVVKDLERHVFGRDLHR